MEQCASYPLNTEGSGGTTAEARSRRKQCTTGPRHSVGAAGRRDGSIVAVSRAAGNCFADWSVFALFRAIQTLASVERKHR